MLTRTIGNWLSLVILSQAALVAMTYSGERVTKINPSGTTGCIDPTAASNFASPSDTAYLYFYATVSNGDSVSNDWLAPDGTTISGSRWNASPGSYCFFGPKVVLNDTSPGRLGLWLARVYNNGVQQFTIPFGVSVIGSQGNSPPAITTSRRSLLVDLSNPGYYAPKNRFDQNDGWQCTRYAWGRAFQKLGVEIHFSNENLGGLDGGKWYSRVLNLSKGDSPRPNSIAVWDDGGTGHVAFVEDVDYRTGNITISEANYSSYQSYDGIRQLALSSINPRGGGSLRLLGYIYLSSLEGFVDVDSNTCTNTLRGWLADRNRPNATLHVDIFDGETFLGNVTAGSYRQDVGGYVGDNGYHGFEFAIPSNIQDGSTHTIWARSSAAYFDIINTQLVSCGGQAGNTSANVQLSFSPAYVSSSPSSSCQTQYNFTLNGKESNGLGVTFSSVNISDAGTWTLPVFGLPDHLGAYGDFSDGLSWCRGPGTSTWTLVGTDSRGNTGLWSATVTFNP